MRLMILLNIVCLAGTTVRAFEKYTNNFVTKYTISNPAFKEQTSGNIHMTIKLSKSSVNKYDTVARLKKVLDAQPDVPCTLTILKSGINDRRNYNAEMFHRECPSEPIGEIYGFSDRYRIARNLQVPIYTSEN
jgi:hypothetical protein